MGNGLLIGIAVMTLALTHTHLGEALVTSGSALSASTVARWAGSTLDANGVLIGNAVIGVVAIGLLVRNRSTVFTNPKWATIWLVGIAILVAYWLVIIVSY